MWMMCYDDDDDGDNNDAGMMVMMLMMMAMMMRMVMTMMHVLIHLSAESSCNPPNPMLGEEFYVLNKKQLFLQWLGFMICFGVLYLVLVVAFLYLIEGICVFVYFRILFWWRSGYVAGLHFLSFLPRWFPIPSILFHHCHHYKYYRHHNHHKV